MHHRIRLFLLVGLTKGFLILRQDFRFVNSPILLLIVLSETCKWTSFLHISLEVIPLSLFTLRTILSSSLAVVMGVYPTLHPVYLPLSVISLIILFTVLLGTKAEEVLLPECPKPLVAQSPPFFDSLHVRFFTIPPVLRGARGPGFLFLP